MRIYLAAAPGEARDAMKYHQALAHVAYRIGEGSTLLRQNLLLQAKGGLLSVSDRDAPFIEDPEALCAAVLRECGRRGYGGALLDFEEAPRRDRLNFAELLGQKLSVGRRTLYLPEAYGGAAPNAVPLICTAVSGGSFVQHLREEAQRRKGPLALDVQRLRMDFRLPARSGQGEPLSGEDLRRLMERQSPSVFFSPDLCARYFTYAQNGETHFVLFDDGDTLNQKLKIGAELGFTAAFLMWPEIRDIAGKLAFRAYP